ncbi:hypothetical protein CO666_05065 [Rhizobium chutanense]|uniref:Uncharacterized protein n=1 Tax=Rhizobium chutanense TaxID=2035448 RepID=A0A2A6JFD5_9HYPH|nr:hypothetical protein [Rhizobium chutanense]PDT05014.1 hypothetical protein CO666_05065 [Rhizobium chutanense]
MQLTQSRLKLQRAKAKIEEIKHVLGATGVHRFVARVDEESGDRFIQLKIFDPNDLVHVIIGETAYQLRSALDVAAVALARFNGTTDVKQVYFPIANSEHEFNAPTGSPQKKMNGLSQPVKDAIALISPYPGGNDLLVGLNDLCNTDKHNNLVASIPQVGNRISVDPYADIAGVVGSFAGRFASAMIDAGEGPYDGVEFKLTPDDGDASQIATLLTTKMRLAMGLIFSGTRYLDGSEAFTTLTAMSSMIESIIENLENAT